MYGPLLAVGISVGGIIGGVGSGAARPAVCQRACCGWPGAAAAPRGRVRQPQLGAVITSLPPCVPPLAGLFGDRLARVGRRGLLTAGTSVAATPLMAASFMLPDYQQSFFALLIGYALRSAGGGARSQQPAPAGDGRVCCSGRLHAGPRCCLTHAALMRPPGLPAASAGAPPPPSWCARCRRRGWAPPPALSTSASACCWGRWGPWASRRLPMRCVRVRGGPPGRGRWARPRGARPQHGAAASPSMPAPALLH